MSIRLSSSSSRDAFLSFSAPVFNYQSDKTCFFMSLTLNQLSTINQTNLFSFVPIQGWINCAVISLRKFLFLGLALHKGFFCDKR